MGVRPHSQSLTLPISVLIVTKSPNINQLSKSLASVASFNDVVIVESDQCNALQKELSITKYNPRVLPYTWSGKYPKKRQYCLDTIDFKHDWVLMLDADEYMTASLVEELCDLLANGAFYKYAGFFVKGRYMMDSKILKAGMKNTKLCLINRYKMHFPKVNDLGFNVLGEIEGHYQPVLRPRVTGKIGHLKSCVIHDAFLGQVSWLERHKKYAYWEANMIIKKAYPKDPNFLRQALKNIFRRSPFRAFIAYSQSFVFALGFLDGRRGHKLAYSRYKYYDLVKKAINNIKM